MHVSETLHNLAGDVKALDLFAVCDGYIGCLSGFEDQHAIVWQLRDNKHGHNYQDDPQGLVLLEIPRLQQGADDVGIAEYHHYERDAEAHADLER